MENNLEVLTRLATCDTRFLKTHRDQGLVSWGPAFRTEKKPRGYALSFVVFPSKTYFGKISKVK